MKKKILILMLGFLLIAVNLYAAGDLIVEGNAGIGTTTPTTKLDVVGNIKGTGGLWLNGATGSTPTSGIGTRLMWIPAKAAFRAGSVGGTGTAWDDANIGLYSFAAGYNAKASGIHSVAIGRGGTADSIAAVEGAVALGGAYVTGTYAVGIGAGAAAQESVAIAIGYAANATNMSSISLGSYGSSTGQNSILIGSQIESDTVLLSSGTGSILIGTVDWGYAGIAQASGDYSVAIGHNVSATATSAIAIGDALENSTANSFAVGFGQIDLLVTGGNVGIGTTTPAYKLDVAGTVNASGGYTQISDVKFKKDITAIESPLNKILNIKGVSYSFKTDEYKDRGFSEGTHYGVIGQEVEKVLPEVVKESPNGEKTVSYTELIPVLIEAVKEQQKVIEELKAEVRQLKAKDLVAKSQ